MSALALTSLYGAARARLRLNRARSEEGIIALMTVIFIMTIGTVSLFVLWGLAYTSGAYTSLYGAAQSAAYAAASEVEYNPLNSSSRQLPFECGPGFDSTIPNGLTPVCNTGRTAEAAKELLASQLRGQRPFFLTYGGNVRLADENGNNVNGVLAYEIPYAPGAAYDADPICSGSAPDPNREDTLVRTCWVNPIENAGLAEVVDPNYVSGVVVILEADVPFVPLFNNKFTPTIHLRVAVSARSGQQQAFTGTNTP